MAPRKQIRYSTTPDGLKDTLSIVLKKDIPIELVTFQKAIALQIYRTIIFRSPVDRGFYRASHNVSVDRRLLTVPTQPSGSRGLTQATGSEVSSFHAAISTLSDLEPGHTIWITSNLPYSEVIEFGGYPVPVVRGSYIRRGRPGAPGYFILSAGGFSRQAPRGVYRISAREVVEKARRGGLIE